MLDRIASCYYAYCYGEYESMTCWLWVYGHVSILLATALSGYAVARQRYLLALLLVPFPLVYLSKRYEKARTDKVQAETPVSVTASKDGAARPPSKGVGAVSISSDRADGADLSRERATVSVV